MRNSIEIGRYFAVLFLLLISMTTKGQDFPIKKTLDWNIHHPIHGDLIHLGQEGTVQQALIQSGELPDPYVGMNESKFSWIEDHFWKFESIFKVSKEELDKEFIDLVFENVDTYASIFLNDSLILKTENAFKPYTIEVKQLLKEGENTLTAVFTPPIIYHKQTWDTASFHYPAPNDVNPVAIAPLARKPQYQFGWDWALRLNTIGFNKPVQLVAFNTNRIVGRSANTEVLDNGKGLVKYNVFFRYAVNDLKWSSFLQGELNNVNVLGNRVEAIFEIENPNLWWPRGHGKQFLYSDQWTIRFEDFFEKVNIRYGIRNTELIQNEDQWGTSYVVRINNKDIFCKGGDYIPQDMFPTRVTDDALRNMIEVAYKSNFNMIRVWGGGYYPDDAFYEACDELGIMVWQDFMFACAMYPGDEAFLKNVKGELDYQIPRIAAHPSVVLFNGNNEVEVAWGNWGFQSKYNLDSTDSKVIEKAYDDLFKNLIPGRMNNYTNIPYVHTSPLSNWGNEEFYNHGSQHYWGVWHGKDPIEDFGKKIGRFNAEYGFQSFPQESTLLTFSNPSEWDLDSAVMKHHQKSYVGNGMIAKHSDLLYGKPKDFEEFVYFSQLTQARAVGLAVSGHRINWPRCTGTLYWQLNDCWPAPTWSSLDYYNNWKILQYEVKDLYRDVAVLAKEEKLGERKYYLVSDLSDTVMCDLFYSVYDLDGNLRFKNNVSQLLRGQEVSEICVNTLCPIEEENYILAFNWNVKGITSGAKLFSHQTSPRVKPDPSTIWLEITKDDEGYLLWVNSEKPLFDFWLTSTKNGVQISGGYRNVLFNGKEPFKITTKESLSVNDFKFYYR